jgi:hypothetical protein
VVAEIPRLSAIILSGLSPRAVANLDRFGVGILRIDFSASLVAAGVSAEIVQRLA